MTLPMRPSYEQPLVAIQLAEHRMDLEEASQRGVRLGGELRGAPASRLYLPEQLFMAPAARGLNRIGRLHSRGTVDDGLQQSVLAAFPRACLGRVGSPLQGAFDTRHKPAFGNRQVLEDFSHRPSIGSRFVIELLRRKTASRTQ